ncbi:MAG: flavin reductase family protein [Flavobacteriia bacterium]|jgi:flavin reductase (DIM6/NTAB) family NADH-FMN oxidoreductase RutF
MKTFSAQDIANLDKLFRANLINSIYGPKPTFLIGTKNNLNQENLAIFNSIIHLGANPALVGFIQRPLISTSHTYKNILETGFYTLNQLNEKMLPHAHFTAVKFEVEQSEFEKCGFTSEYSEDFIAPFVVESVVQIGVKFVEEHHLKVNDTRLIIGQIEEIHVKNENSIASNGIINHELNQVAHAVGLESYYSSKFIQNLPHPKLDNYKNYVHEGNKED